MLVPEAGWYNIDRQHRSKITHPLIERHDQQDCYARYQKFIK